MLLDSQIIEKYQKGYSLNSLEKEFGVSRYLITKELKKRNIIIDSKKRKKIPTSVLRICSYCNKKEYVDRRSLLYQRKKWLGLELCKKCAYIERRKKYQYHGRKIDRGYISVWDPSRKKEILEHHKVFQENTGIDTSKGEVHHINGDKSDNYIKNLHFFPAPTEKKEHSKVHQTLQKLSYDLIKRKIIIWDENDYTYYLNPNIDLSTLEISLGFEDIALKQNKLKVISRSDILCHSEIIKGVFRPIPLIAANMSTVTNSDFCIKLWNLGAMGVLHRASDDQFIFNEVKKISNKCDFTAASTGLDFLFAKKLINSGANIIFIDVAHGFSNEVFKLAKKIKEFNYRCKVVIGNTINTEILIEKDVINYVDAIKVGIAQGFVCETKNSAGCTEKQFSAVYKFKNKARNWMPIISDGGIREPADFVKAMGAGASSVMAGKIFAECPESSAPETIINGISKKLYAGMASRYVQEKWHGKVKNDCPEGTVKYLDIGEPAENLLKRYSGALRSGISYSGSSNIKEFQEKVEFVRI